MHRLFSIIIIILFSGFLNIEAQELNARLTINRQQVQADNQSIFSSLQEDVNRLLNEQKWTNASFDKKERISCSVIITLTQMPSDGVFNAEIQINTQRPVYNSTYITTLINYKDTEFQFNYLFGQTLDHNINNISNNLVATVAFYAYIIIGLDFDSFSLNGGKPYFSKAMDIANSAQTLNTKGWEPFSNNKNRYDLALALTEESSKSFHEAWYNYHRLGLDEMASNPTRGRIRIIETLKSLKELYNSRPQSPLLTLFSDTKLDELVKVCSLATPEEKKEIKATLQTLFPAKSNIINMLK